MRKITQLIAALSVFGLGVVSCTVGVDGGGPVGACEDIACGDALSAGLATPGDALCSAAADSAYGDLLGCACLDGGGQGLCDSECGDNLCSDLGESSDCGDCLNANCAPEHDTCANN